MRVLLAARLSRPAKGDGGDDRTDRDEDVLTQWASAYGHDIVAMTKDHVSGSVSPFDREHLGPWLNDPALRMKWDAILVTSIDRMGRDATNALLFRNWVAKNGKQLIVTSRNMEWPSKDDNTAGLQWGILELLADMERANTVERNAAAREETARRGGVIRRAPWGFENVGDRYEKHLQPIAALVDVQREIVARALSGDSYSSIGQWLTEQGHKTATGGAWSDVSVSNILRQPALKGQALDADGKIEQTFDAILTAAEWRRLQDALDARPKRRGAVTSASPMLLGSIVCGICGGRMQRHARTFYRCNAADQKTKGLVPCVNQINLADTDAWVDLWFTESGPWARTELVEQTIVPGDDHTAEVADIKEQIALLDPEDVDYMEQLQALRADLARVKALPVEAPSIEERGTGQTVGELWASLSTDERRRYLTAAGVKVVVHPMGEVKKIGKQIRRVVDPDVEAASPWRSITKHWLSLEGDPHAISAAVRILQDEDVA